MEDKPIGPEPAPAQAPFTPRGAIDPRTRAKLGAVLILAIAVIAAVAFFFSRKSAPQPTEPRPTQRMATPDEQRRIETEQKVAQERAYEEGRRRAAMDAISNRFPRDDGQTPAATEAPQKTPAEQRAEDLAKLEHDAAFADNFVQVADKSEKPQRTLPHDAPNALMDEHREQTNEGTLPHPKLGLQEGTFIPAVLVNKLDGDFTGPVVVQVSNDVYSPDLRELKIPQGSRILGEAQRVGQQNQQRLAVTFHKLQIADGSELRSYYLDAPGLDQEGATALKDKVNNHYLQIFGASLAIGAIGGLAQIGNGNYGGYYGYDAESEFRNGITQSMAQSSTQILSRFLNRLPTITIRPGTRCVVYLRGDI